MTEVDPRAYFKLQKKVLTAFGAWPKDKGRWLWLYNAWAILFSYNITYTISISLIINMILSFGDLERMVNASYYLLTHLSFVAKLTFFILRRHKFNELLSMLDNPHFNQILPHQKLIYDSWLKTSSFFAYFFLVACYIVTLFYDLFPIIDKDENNILPIGGWFPFDVRHSKLNRIFVYIVQVRNGARRHFAQTVTCVINYRLCA